MYLKRLRTLPCPGLQRRKRFRGKPDVQSPAEESMRTREEGGMGCGETVSSPPSFLQHVTYTCIDTAGLWSPSCNMTTCHMKLMRSLLNIGTGAAPNHRKQRRAFRSGQNWSVVGLSCPFSLMSSFRAPDQNNDAAIYPSVPERIDIVPACKSRQIS